MPRQRQRQRTASIICPATGSALRGGLMVLGSMIGMSHDVVDMELPLWVKLVGLIAANVLGVQVGWEREGGRYAQSYPVVGEAGRTGCGKCAGSAGRLVGLV